MYRTLKVSGVIAFNVLQNICIFQWVRGLKSITYDGRRVKRKRAKSASLPALSSQNLPLNISSGPTNKLQGLFFRWKWKTVTKFQNLAPQLFAIILKVGCVQVCREGAQVFRSNLIGMMNDDLRAALSHLKKKIWKKSAKKEEKWSRYCTFH